MYLNYQFLPFLASIPFFFFFFFFLFHEDDTADPACDDGLCHNLVFEEGPIRKFCIEWTHPLPKFHRSASCEEEWWYKLPALPTELVSSLLPARL